MPVIIADFFLIPNHWLCRNWFHKGITDPPNAIPADYKDT